MRTLVPNIETNKLIKMPDEEYFAIERTSSSAIRTFAQNRRKYYLQYVQKCLDDTESPALRIGSAVHAWALEGESAYKERFVVGPPGSSRTNMYQEFVDATPNQLTVLSEKEAQQVKYMVLRLWQNKLFSELMEEINPDVEHAVFFEYEGYDCKSKLDVLGFRKDGTPVLLDLKTTQDCEPKKFQESVDYWGYIAQVAFYRTALRKCGYDGPIETYIAAVDKKFPTAAALFQIPDEDCFFGELDNKYHLRQIRSCYDSGDWSCEYEQCLNTLRYHGQPRIVE